MSLFLEDHGTQNQGCEADEHDRYGRSEVMCQLDLYRWPDGVDTLYLNGVGFWQRRGEREVCNSLVQRTRFQLRPCMGVAVESCDSCTHGDFTS